MQLRKEKVWISGNSQVAKTERERRERKLQRRKNILEMKSASYVVAQTAYNSMMNPLGVVNLRVTYDSQTQVLKSQVVSGSNKPLLSAQTCQKLGLSS